MSATLQEQVRQAAIDAATFYNEIWRQYDSECADSMIELGMDYYSLTDDERQEWTDYAQTLESTFREMVGADFFDQATALLG
jgi:TRAP-type C4-dicarboxylate transport system substrate-binding protein